MLMFGVWPPRVYRASTQTERAIARFVAIAKEIENGWHFDHLTGHMIKEPGLTRRKHEKFVKELDLLLFWIPGLKQSVSDEDTNMWRDLSDKYLQDVAEGKDKAPIWAPESK